MAETRHCIIWIAIGMSVALAVVCFVIRGKGHHDEIPVAIREQFNATP